MDTLLEVKDLGVSFYSDSGETKAIKNAGFLIKKGEFFGIVGESGSGKSVAAKSILKLLPENGKINSGMIQFQGKNLLTQSEKELQAIRGREISIVFQDSLSALNPVYTIGSKLIELLRRNHKMTRSQAKARAIELLTAVGINDPEKHLKSYPHELSGGMRQRVMIAMAVSSSPKLMIADEPTTALDVTIQAQILNLLKKIQKSSGMSVVLITHDLGVVAQMCGRIAVMCGGYVVEEGTAEDIFFHSRHPYTQALIASMPKVGEEPFVPFLEKPVNDKEDDLCPFLNRCAKSDQRCETCLPEFYQEHETHYIRCHRKGEIK